MQVADRRGGPCPWALRLGDLHGEPVLKLEFPQGGDYLSQWPQPERREVSWSLAYHCPKARPDLAVVFGAVTSVVAQMRFRADDGSVLTHTPLALPGMSQFRAFAFEPSGSCDGSLLALRDDGSLIERAGVTDVQRVLRRRGVRMRKIAEGALRGYHWQLLAGVSNGRLDLQLDHSFLGSWSGPGMELPPAREASIPERCLDSDCVIRAGSLSTNLERGVQVVAGEVQPEAANVRAVLADSTSVEAQVIDVPELPTNAFVAAAGGRSAIIEVVAFNSAGTRLGADDHVFRVLSERHKSTCSGSTW